MKLKFRGKAVLIHNKFRMLLLNHPIVIPIIGGMVLIFMIGFSINIDEITETNNETGSSIAYFNTSNSIEYQNGVEITYLKLNSSINYTINNETISYPRKFIIRDNETQKIYNETVFYDECDRVIIGDKNCETKQYLNYIIFVHQDTYEIIEKTMLYSPRFFRIPERAKTASIQESGISV